MCSWYFAFEAMILFHVIYVDRYQEFWLLLIVTQKHCKILEYSMLLMVWSCSRKWLAQRNVLLSIFLDAKNVCASIGHTVTYKYYCHPIRQKRNILSLLSNILYECCMMSLYCHVPLRTAFALTQFIYFLTLAYHPYFPAFSTFSFKQILSQYHIAAECSYVLDGQCSWSSSLNESLLHLRYANIP